MLCAPALAAYDYNGSSLDTIKEGTVKGDVYISSGDKAGFNNNALPTSYYVNNSLITNFTNVPNKDDIEWAELKVGVVGVNTSRSGWVNVDLSPNGGSPVSLGTKYLCCPPLTGCSDGVDVSGTGVYLVKYDCTAQFQNGTLDGPNITATVNTWPNSTAPSLPFDGRIYGAVLIVVYKGGDCYTQYWINQGNMNLHKNANVWVNGSSQSFEDLDATLTWFNGTAYEPCPLGNSTLTVGYFAGDSNQRDYLYYNVTKSETSPYNLSNFGWDIDGFTNWHLDSNNVANSTNESGSYTKYFDLHTFGVKDLVDHADDNYAVFWRGHGNLGDNEIFDPAYPGVNNEVESYVTPFLAVLKTTRITTYDFSNETAGRAGVDLFAYKYQNDSKAPITNDVPDIEFSDAEYGNIKYDDGQFQDNSADEDNYAAHRFVFNVSCCSNASYFDAINVTWNGKGLNDAGNGVTLYIWNYNNGAYEQLDICNDAAEQTLTGEKTANLGDYISNDKLITVLAEQNSETGIDGTSIIYTDYVKLVLKQ